MSVLNGTAQVAAQGVSLWLDDCSRSLVTSSDFDLLLATQNITGVTTNPAILAKAISNDHAYDSALAAAKATGTTASEVVTELVCTDVQLACAKLLPVYENSNQLDGYVSLEVDPALANDAAGTFKQAKELWQRVNMPNLMIKIPATEQGLIAVSDCLGAGMNVNVTLIFSLPQYRAVLNAYQCGLEKAHAAGLALANIASVASVFISRFDTALADNSMLPANTVGIANGYAAQQIHAEVLQSERSALLTAAGAHPQQLLWASTGVKDPQLPGSYYVRKLLLAGTVNTMPLATVQAVAADTTEFTAVTAAEIANAQAVLDQLPQAGVDYAQLTAQLATAGLEQFSAAWQQLLTLVEEKLK